MARERKMIVVGWLTVEQVWDGEPFAVDLGRLPKMVETRKANACVWLLNGTQGDERKARAYITKEHASGRVFTFPAGEKTPLEKARAALLA